jgi:ATP-dependent DNA helicase RecQ
LNPASLLKKYFGYDSFRPLQSKIIKAVLDGSDAFVLMPTGGGKSICYQIPALCKDGICIVISPLIALMKDQVESLKLNGVEAAFINSSQSYSEQKYYLDLAMEGKLKLLYIAPERIPSGNFLEILERINVNLFAIDEAHCISQWGHDFRPEYTQLKILKDKFPDVPFIALTATADKLTRKDILKQLSMEDAEVFISSFDRPNISLSVFPAEDRLKQILNFLYRHKNEPGIIYCLSRSSAESMAKKLEARDFKAGFYHAGMEKAERSEVQEKFLRDDLQVICATIAFGMGIDKPNVRWVIHYNLPKNIEGYYQEIGRGGRDGMDANAILFYGKGDLRMLQKFIDDGAESQRNISNAKLERIQEYAEARTCRRKILLSYFGEILENDCGNCDNCRNENEKFDGTILTQKALSAIARSKEQLNKRSLNDVLRGALNKTVITNGYQKLKTFAAGKDLGRDEWKDYIKQMINHGIIEIAYDDGNKLKLNPTSREILFNSRKIFLIRHAPEEIQKETPKDRAKEIYDESLFKRLRSLRKSLADMNDIPPYMIFHDTTLKEMSLMKPSDRQDMLQVQGVGYRKYELYGEYFLNEIRNYTEKKKKADSFF